MPGRGPSGSSGSAIRTSDELVRAPRQLAIALRDRVRDVRPPAQRHAVPVDRDVGMVILELGQLADAVHERERLPEAGEAELALERAVDLGPAGGCLHGRSMETVSPRSA